MTQSKLRLRKHVSVVETDDGAVLLDEKSGRYFQLNNTACLIVRTLVDGGSVADAAQALAQTHGVSDERAGHDVAALVAQLRSAKLADPA
jgi:hypothetical protein